MKIYYKNFFCSSPFRGLLRNKHESLKASIRKLRLALLCSVLVGICGAAPAQDKDEAKAAHALYEKALKKKSAPERVAALREAAGRHPQAAELHYALGREFFALAQWDSAAARFERAAALDAGLAQKTNLPAVLASAYAKMASHNFSRGRFLPALEAALAGLRHDTNAVPCLATATVAYQQLGEYEQAIAMGLRLLVLQPSAQNYNNLGAAYESKGDWLAAKKYYSEAVALAPNLAEAQSNLNRVHARLEPPLAVAAGSNQSAPPVVKKESDQSSASSSKRKEANAAAKKIPTKNAALAPVSPSIKTARERTPTQPPSSSSKKDRGVKAKETARTPAVKPPDKPKIKPSVPPSSTSKKDRGVKAKKPARAPAVKPSDKLKIELSVPVKDSVLVQSEEKAATAIAPQVSRGNSVWFWIWSVAGLTGVAWFVWWKFFPHRALALRFALERLFLSIQLGWQRAEGGEQKAKSKEQRAKSGEWRAKSRGQRAEGKERRAEGKLPVAAAAHAEAGDESRRMLHRVAIAENAPESLPSPEAWPGKDDEAIAVNGKHPEETVFATLTPPEPPAIPEREPAPVPEKTAPALGLQTEMLFAEMIAGALASFEEADENGRAEAKTRLAAAGEAREEKAEESSDASEARAFIAPAEQADAPQGNGKAEFNNILANNLPNEPPAEIATTSVSALFTIREDFVEERREPPMEMTTMGFVVGVEEMMREPVETMAATPPAAATSGAGKTALHLATRTMEITALTQSRIGRYLIEKEIAKAATGRIYKAWDPKLDRIVVLKTVQYGFAASAQEIAALKDRIYREARAIAKLSHPNIVVVYDVDDQPEFSYLVMEYLEGRDLKQTLENERRLDYKRALHIVMQVCDAMDYAHRAGVFHRDVKPSNIMLLENDETKVTDFGIAKISNYLSLTQTGRVLGTPSYMAPEQIEGQTTDGRADLFSLGVVLYELIAGKRPFMADSLAALAYKIVHKPHLPPSLENVEIPLALDEVAQRVLAKNPEERYQSAAEFREALAAVMTKLNEC